MKDFDQLLQEAIGEYEGRHDDLIFQAPALYRLLTHLLDDPRLPPRLRPMVLAAIAYFVLPADIISESLEGPFGYIDDIWLCAFVANHIQQKLGEDILVANWDGEAPLLQLIKDILTQGESFLGEKKALILQYISYERLVDVERF
jgi:uncharacterized membrane protein YkvA (DUF1232 family)